MKKLKIFLFALMLASTAVTGINCDNDGPAEEAGEEIDDAVDEAEDAVD